MDALLVAIGRLVMGFLLVLGPLVLILIILKAQERRESDLQAVVSRELNTPALRGLVSARVRSGFLFRDDSVILDLWGCSREQMWDLISRLSARLPSSAQLVVTGISNPSARSSLTLKVEKGPSCICSTPCTA